LRSPLVRQRLGEAFLLLSPSHHLTSLGDSCSCVCAFADVLLLLQCLPICVDIGTNNPAYLEDPDYRGIKAPRVTGGPAVLLLLLLLYLSSNVQWHLHLFAGVLARNNGSCPIENCTRSCSIGLLVYPGYHHQWCARIAVLQAQGHVHVFVLLACTVFSCFLPCLLQALSLTSSWAR
jgi:hypothetical protein